MPSHTAKHSYSPVNLQMYLISLQLRIMDAVSDSGLKGVFKSSLSLFQYVFFISFNSSKTFTVLFIMLTYECVCISLVCLSTEHNWTYA